VLCIIDTEEHESPAASYDGGSGVPKRRAEKTFFSACRKKETLLYLYLYLISIYRARCHLTAPCHMTARTIYSEFFAAF